MFIGKLISWHCLYLWIKQKDNMKCPSCNSLINLNKVIPLYLENKNDNSIQDDDKIENNENLLEIPPKPRPCLDIKNEDSYGNANDFESYYLFNTHNGKKLAGFGWFPSIFVLLFNIQSNPKTNLIKENAPELFYYKYLNIFLMFIFSILIILIIYL